MCLSLCDMGFLPAAPTQGKVRAETWSPVQKWPGPSGSPSTILQKAGPAGHLGISSIHPPPLRMDKGKGVGIPPIGAAVGCTPRLLCSRLTSSMLTRDPRTQRPLRFLCGFLAGGTRLQKDGSPGATSTKS